MFIVLALCGQVLLSEQDLYDIIASYKSKTTEMLRVGMPPLVTDPKFRQSIHNRLPKEFTNHLITDPQVTESLRKVLEPVLSYYGREYDLMIIDVSTPIIMADSGVVLAVTTGLILAAENDDTLLGYVAHE